MSNIPPAGSSLPHKRLTITIDRLFLMELIQNEFDNQMNKRMAIKKYSIIDEKARDSLKLEIYSSARKLQKMDELLLEYAP